MSTRLILGGGISGHTAALHARSLLNRHHDFIYSKGKTFLEGSS